ncbi:unnamed protein product [Miscanthus lutarioriparius]|uniref:Uncharacterized protein n=1 Tax=Miscanthus lutarioriparius TaxID=422564 RepID=A0A811SDU0_9POAL|nr:unnamed protein product [Miscanthus lutarioriparius]
MDDMTWAMDARLDATQLWSLDGYKGLPRVELDIPVVSMDEPDAIFFEVCEKHHEKHGDETAASASPEAAILAALQAIPGLDRDDLLKAYRILAHDNSGCRFRALMGLPMDFRKDCVLMEIKASEACILCSLCSADLQLKE